MQITDVRVRKVAKEGKLKAVVSITMDEEFVVHDIKVIEGEKGLFIAMPSKKAMDGEYRDIAHPINSGTRERIQKLILENMKGLQTIFLMAAGAFLIIIEYVIWHQFMDLQVSTIFVSVGMFLFALQYSDFAPSKLLIRIGHISQYVYIFHIPVIILLNAILVKHVPDAVAATVMPFLVILCTVLVSYGFDRMFDT